MPSMCKVQVQQRLTGSKHFRNRKSKRVLAKLAVALTPKMRTVQNGRIINAELNVCQLSKVLSFSAIESPNIKSKHTTTKRMHMYSFDILKVTDPKSNPWGSRLLYSAV